MESKPIKESEAKSREKNPNLELRNSGTQERKEGGAGFSHGR
jgi:hypothetical protein